MFNHLLDSIGFGHIGCGIGDADPVIRRNFLLQVGDLLRLSKPVEHDVRARGGKRTGDAQSDSAG